MQFSCQVECFITALCWTTGHAPSCSLYSLCPVRIETSSASPMPWAMAVAVGRLQMLQSTVRWRCAAEPCHVVDAKSCLTGALSRKRCELREIWDLGTSVSKKIWRCDWIEIRYAISLGFQFLILIYMYTYIYIYLWRTKRSFRVLAAPMTLEYFPSVFFPSICFLTFQQPFFWGWMTWGQHVDSPLVDWIFSLEQPATELTESGWSNWDLSKIHLFDGKKKKVSHKMICASFATFFVSKRSPSLYGSFYVDNDFRTYL